jgi:hypothetical protein
MQPTPSRTAFTFQYDEYPHSNPASPPEGVADLILVRPMKTLSVLLLLMFVGCGARRSNPNWQVEHDAQPSETHPYGGFWKIEAQNEFGLAIGPHGKDSYYVSFCGPGGCFAKGEYRPFTSLVGDPTYRIVDNNQIDVQGREGFTAYHRSAGRQSASPLQR